MLTDESDVELSALARDRARGIVNYIALLLALARDSGNTSEWLAKWVQKPYEELGLYAELSRLPELERLKVAADKFAEGRRLLYDEVEIADLTATEGGFRIRSRVWYVEQPIETAVLFGVEIDDIRSYASVLASRGLALQGIHAEISADGHFEVAVLTLGDRKSGVE